MEMRRVSDTIYSLSTSTLVRGALRGMVSDWLPSVKTADSLIRKWRCDVVRDWVMRLVTLMDVGLTTIQESVHVLPDVQP